MEKMPVKRSKPHYLYAILSVTSVLFLLGSFGFVVFKAQNLVTGLKENINIIVELKQDYPKDNLQQLRRFMQRGSFLKPGSLKFVSKEDGMRELEKDFGDDVAMLGLPNPLADIFTFNVKASYMQKDSLMNVRQGIREFSIVNDVFYQQQFIQSVTENLNWVSYFLLISGGVLFVIAVFLIYNTVRLALYDNRFLIKNMQLVGASWSFISWPYLWKAIRNGTISAILAISILVLIVFWIENNIPGLDLSNNLADLAILFAIILILGIVINMISTYFAVNKYLKMRVDDLY